MSERPEADKAAGGPTLKKQPYEEFAQEMKPLHPSTEEKPGTGLPKKTDPVDGPESFKEAPVTGSATYDDGYEMSKSSDNTFWLKDADGRQAFWNDVVHEWVDSETANPMPDGWSKGHYPSSQAADSGQGTTQAHPLKK